MSILILDSSHSPRGGLLPLTISSLQNNCSYLLFSPSSSLPTFSHLCEKNSSTLGRKAVSLPAADQQSVCPRHGAHQGFLTSGPRSHPSCPES